MQLPSTHDSSLGRSHARVSAFGDEPNRCQNDGWLSGPGGEQVFVTCVTPTGEPVDTPFVMHCALLPA